MSMTTLERSPSPPAQAILWDACVRSLPLQGKLEAARAGGFTHLTMPARVFKQHIDSGFSARDLRNKAADMGVSFEFLDGFTSWAPITTPASAPSWLSGALASLDVGVEESFRICDELGMTNIVAVAAFDPNELHLNQQIDAFGYFCQRALARGKWIDLEFIPMLGIADLATAWEIVRQAGSPNCGILFDTWHFMRGNPDFDLLKRIPPNRIVNIQLADAANTVKGANLWEDAHRHRQYSGEGELPIVRMLEAIQSSGAVRSIGPEVFSDEAVRLPPAEVGRRAAKTTGSVATAAKLPVGWKRRA
jgi:sugar phosphate isomerase/epimerase